MPEGRPNAQIFFVRPRQSNSRTCTALQIRESRVLRAGSAGLEGWRSAPVARRSTHPSRRYDLRFRLEVKRQTQPHATRLMDDHATLNFNGRTTDNNLSFGVLIVIVRAALVGIGAAAILLRLAGRHSAIAPARLLALAPAGRPRVAGVGAVFVSAPRLPALIIFAVFVPLLVLVSVISVICH